GDLVQAKLLALVQVRGAGQAQHEQRCGAGAAQAQPAVQLGLVAAVQEPGLAVLGLPGVGQLGQAVAGGVADHVVVGEDPGGGCPGGGRLGEVLGDDFCEGGGVEV